MDLHINEGVYEPAEDSTMLLEAALSLEPESALEVGTGCGLTAIAISRAGCPRVVATDVSLGAILCASANARRYAPDIDLVLCDLFEAISKPFDLVLFNPPYLPVENTNGEESYWAGGFFGRELIDRFIRGLTPYIAENGRALLIQSSINDLDRSRVIAQEQGLGLAEITSQKFFFESLHVVELTPGDSSHRG